MRFKLKVKSPEDFSANVDNRVVSFTSANAADVTLKDFVQKLHDTFGIEAQSSSGSSLDISFGFPPKTVNCSEHEDWTLEDIGLTSGSVVTLEKKKKQGGNLSSEAEGTTGTNPTSTEWHCEACTYLNNDERSSCDMCGTERPQNSQAKQGSGNMKKVVVDSDNSCLFRIVGYLLENKSMDKVSKLRQVIADTVSRDPETYNEVSLGRPPADYARWIKQSASWGGAIELAILSDYYQVEICAFNVQTATPLIFGQDKAYPRRIYLVFDGIHYDGIAKETSQGQQTVFDREDSTAYQEALSLVEKAKEERQFTDVSNFTLKCEKCKQGLVGQEDALKHAQQTGHSQFSEY